jgi:hypothetical protein
LQIASVRSKEAKTFDTWILAPLLMNLGRPRSHEVHPIATAPEYLIAAD